MDLSAYIFYQVKYGRKEGAKSSLSPNYKEKQARGATIAVRADVPAFRSVVVDVGRTKTRQRWCHKDYRGPHLSYISLGSIESRG